MLTAQANGRPTISFNGQKYYLADFHYEVDGTHSPVNVKETYFPEGETSDTYTKSIQRLTYLQVTDYNASVNSTLSELKEDNPGIPSEKIEDPNSKKLILKVSFWWPFRTNIIRKSVYVFQEDKIAKRAMCYVYTELQFHEPTKAASEELKKQGKALLIDDKITNLVKDLDF